jgi:hypothetical protein
VPNSHPRVSIRSTQQGEEVCTDIIYLERIPYLHAEDRYTAFSECSRLQNRLILEQVRTLSNIWIPSHGVPKRITPDSEYDKAEYRAFCDSIVCELAIVATEANHQNGTIEAGNRVLRIFYGRIRIAEAHTIPQKAVEKANIAVHGQNARQLMNYGSGTPPA